MTLDKSPFTDDLKWLRSQTPHDRHISAQAQAHHAMRIGERVTRDRQDALSARNDELKIMLTE